MKQNGKRLLRDNSKDSNHYPSKNGRIEKANDLDENETRRKIPYFYRIEKSGSPTSYLFGTVHVATFENCSYYPEMSNGFKQATHVISEIGEESIEICKRLRVTKNKMKNWATLENLLFESGNCEDGKPFHQLLDFMRNYPWHLHSQSEKMKQELTQPESLKKLDYITLLTSLREMLTKKLRSTWLSAISLWTSPRFLKSFLSLFFVEKLKVAAGNGLHEIIKLVELKQAEFDLSDIPIELQSLPIDTRLVQVACMQNKKNINLETVDAQISMDDVETTPTIEILKGREEVIEKSFNDIKHALKMIIDDLDSNPKRCLMVIQEFFIRFYGTELAEIPLRVNKARMVNAYDDSEDIDLNFINDITKDKDNVLKSTTTRNKKWIAPILDVIEKHPSFIHVGLGHFESMNDPEKGLIPLLKEKGFTLVPVECPRIPLKNQNSNDHDESVESETGDLSDSKVSEILSSPRSFLVSKPDELVSETIKVHSTISSSSSVTKNLDESNRRLCCK